MVEFGHNLVILVDFITGDGQQLLRHSLASNLTHYDLWWKECSWWMKIWTLRYIYSRYIYTIDVVLNYAITKIWKLRRESQVRENTNAEKKTNTKSHYIITNTKNEKDICGRQRLVHCEEVWNLPGGSTAANSTCSVLPLSFEKDVNEDEKTIFHFHFYFNDE